MRQRLKNSSLTEKRVLWEHNHTAWLIHKYCVYEDQCSSKDRTYWSPWQQGAIDFHGNRWCSSGCIYCNKMTPHEACRPPISIFCFVIGRRGKSIQMGWLLCFEISEHILIWQSIRQYGWNCYQKLIAEFHGDWCWVTSCYKVWTETDWLIT